MVSTIGVFLHERSGRWSWFGTSLSSFFRGKVAGDNPWDAWTLEWATTSPPPHENFVALPPIHSRRPLWDIENPDRPDPVVGDDQAVTLPNHNKTGILAFLFSEVGFFGTLILAYLYFYAQPQAGPGPKELDVPRTLIFSVCLFSSSFTFWRSEVALTKQRRGSMLGWLALTIVLGGSFPRRPGERILETVPERGRSQHQYVFDHVLHPDWVPRFARAPWSDRAAHLSLDGVGGRFGFSQVDSALNVSVTTGTLSMSSGSLFYSLFTSFHLFDDYLPILHYRLDVEFFCSNS